MTSRPKLSCVQVMAAAAALLVALLSGCTSAASPQTPPNSTAAPVTIDVTISRGNVSPNGKRIDLTRGQTVIVNVTSDIDDEVHAHTGGDGYRIEVTSGQPARGQFTVTERGSFALESHHLKKIIAILNVR